MGFLKNLFTGGAVSAVQGVANVIDTFVETPDEKRAADALKLKMAQRPDELQAQINQIEAGHRSLFVAGWRPAIGWIGAAALAWTFIGHDIASWLCAYFAPHIIPPPLGNTEILLEIVIGMLGFGSLRTFEKIRGKAR